MLKSKTVKIHIVMRSKIFICTWIRLKFDSQLQIRRLAKVSVQYREKLRTSLDNLKNGILTEIGSMLHENPNFGSTFLNPLVIFKNKDSKDFSLDAGHLNINTDQSSESKPLEPLATQLARANKQIKAAMDLIFAFAHATLDEETIKVIGFPAGDKLFSFTRGFHGPQGLAIFFLPNKCLAPSKVSAVKDLRCFI